MLARLFPPGPVLGDERSEESRGKYRESTVMAPVLARVGMHTLAFGARPPALAGLWCPLQMRAQSHGLVPGTNRENAIHPLAICQEQIEKTLSTP